MAPSIPEEIDVFTRPHGRMKELMNNFTKKVILSRDFNENWLATLFSIHLSFQIFYLQSPYENNS